ncbi:MFS transporter [Paraburkholderia phenoliruptrix]|uniref:Major facilitator superfamily protein n=2 Tax=Paraburkholderia phenoliruptrix TaxID=252970 RepID=K0DZY9_9BURK|nr:MFS transporter [Paraburkholderia phenoliruptrix]AFT90520.1 major facilitator superfamily protein [Paraburkholderia phenoliruptrix BR3459a]CAB4053040.1 putative transport protein HsrA [Paraburkholderia phenoliruptrix]
MAVAEKVLIAPLIVACAMFMESVDANVVVTALPALARDFGRDPIALKVAVTSYALGLGVFIPICGWLADRFGARTVFRSAIGIFMAGSLLCAASNSLVTFTLARFVQGVGGAMMVPVGRIIIFRGVQKADFIRAMHYLNLPVMFGPAAGPLLGGFITTYLHWRLIFLIDVPIGVLGIYLTKKHIANTREPCSGPLDWIGFFLSAGAAVLLLLGLSLIGSELISDHDALGMCVGGVILLVVYMRYARRVRLPLLDLRFFNVPTFQASVLGGSLFRIGLGALPFLLPLMLQEGHDMSAFESGLITCASAFGAVFTRTVASRVLHRYGFRSVLVVNAALSGVSVAACGLLFPGTPAWIIWVVVLLGGFFPALQFTSLNSLTYAEIASCDIGRATSLGSVVQRMSLGLSVAIGGIVVQISRMANGHESIMWSDFWPAFLVLSVCSFASIPVTLCLPPRAGEEIAYGGRR